MMDDLWAKITVLNLLLPLFAVCACLNPPNAAATTWASTSRQAVVVLSSSWEASSAVLMRYERERSGLAWSPVGEPIPVVIGRSGLGWGAGVHPNGVRDGEPVKKEGDGRAPAGIFRLSAAFGSASPEAMAWVRLPYLQATANLLCVDDPFSRHYNRIVDAAQKASDWKSHEAMLRADGLYRLGVVVDHNADPVVPGGGSCIFLHIWLAPDKGTSGCTAMTEKNLETLIRWLDPAARPFLIQLPEAVYRQRQQEWGLP